MARFTLRQLECLAMVGQHGSIAAAATALRLSPSAVTGALNELERILGVQLTIRRKAHGVSLTPSGRYVVSEARNLLQSAADLEIMAGEGGKVVRGQVTIGCYSPLAPTVLTELLDEFGTRFPQVDIDFRADTQQNIHQLLQAGELDLAIVYDFGLPDGTERTLLAATEPTVALPADHRLASNRSVALAELVDEPMILLDVPPSREHTESLFTAAGLAPWIRFRTTDFEVTRSMIARGMGYAILVQRPAANLSYEGRELVTRPIHPVARKVRIMLVRGAAVRLSRAAQAMHDLAVELHPEAEHTGGWQ